MGASTTRIGLAVLSGLLTTAAFPKIGLDLLGWIGLVPLMVGLRNTPTVSEAFRIGCIAGLVHYLTLLYWVAYTMTTYGNLPYALSVPILFLFASFLSLFWAVFSVVSMRLSRRPGMLLAAAPATWVALEYLRSFLFTGFPWGLLGHSLFRRSVLIQICDLTGAYGLSGVMVLCNAAVLLIGLCLFGKPWNGRPVPGRAALAAGVAAVGVLGLVAGYGMWRVRDIDRQIAGADTIRVALVQGNIPQVLKWDPAYQRATTEKYTAMSRSARPPTPDLVIWPETATPFYFGHDARLTRMVIQGVRDTGTDFLIGSPSFSAAPDGDAYYNSAFLIRADGTVSGKYDKAHLVPFGEYVPLKRYLPFLGKIVAQVGDFRPGPAGKVLDWETGGIGVLICYEIIFPELARAAASNGAAILVNLTNDAWYGRSSAPFQHFSTAVFRAVENRRSLVRAANTGISGSIDPAGRVRQQTALFEDAVLGDRVPVLRRQSVYTRFGDLFAIGCALVVLILAAGARVRSVFNRR